ncbi:MAG: thiamine-binding protein [Acidimicrobiales bacterium]|nr:thiamine-binding protein [Acidimicrobiales bacterium]
MTNKRLKLELTIEPFVDANPGPHVVAAIEAAEEAGLEVAVGPFGTTAEGTDALVLSAMSHITGAALATGATRVTLQVTETAIDLA